MTANIEQIFQDFILNKIREIEDQNEDKSAGEGMGAGSKTSGAEKATLEKELRDSGSQKKHKKHKKHKSKKKRRKREKEETSSESGAEPEGRNKRRSRRETPTRVNKEQGEHKHKRRLTGKRKKKKRRRKGAENSSDSDSEYAAKRKGDKSGQSSSPRRREELPDIIPKQDSSNKGRGDEERHSRRDSRSRSHSSSHSHSRSARKSSRSRSRHRSRTRSFSGSQLHRTRSRSSEKQTVVSESVWSAQEPAKNLSPSKPASHPTGSNGKAEEPTQPQNTDQQERQDKPQDLTQKLATGRGTQHSTPNRHLSANRHPTISAGSPQTKPYEHPGPSAAGGKSPAKNKRKASKSPQRSRDRKSSKREKRSRSHRRGSRSRSSSRKRKSRSRSRGYNTRRSHSRSASRGRRRTTFSQRDRWKREPSHSPVLILRRNRSPTWKRSNLSSSPQRISELDKEQLLEIAKANAAAMCAKAGMPIPASLKTSVLPLALPSMAMNAAMASMAAATMTAALSNMGALSSFLPLPSITNKPPTLPTQPNTAALEELKKKAAKQADSISIKEFTDKCKMIADSKGELPVAAPHVSDDEDDGKPFGGSAFREQRAISFNINNTTVRPAVRSDAGIAKEFPVSSGSQHRKKEGETPGAYGEWVPVEKAADKPASAPRKVVVPAVTAILALGEAVVEAAEMSASTPENDSVFPDPVQQPVDISQAVTERIKAQKRLAENPYDVSAICMLSRAQEQVDAWAQSNAVPGLFTGSTGAQVLSSEELSTSGPQAWLKKDQFLRAAPVSGGVGEFLMRKMGWKTGEGLGRNREGTVEPIVIDFKVDRKGLVAEGEKPQKQTGGLVVTKDLMGKHPVSALIELCNKRRITQPDFVMVHHSGPDHRKNFLFKVTVNGTDYQPQTASPNKKHAKAMAATVALQALGEVPVDGPGLYTGPVFTAASTGPLFST
ncbi:protein SON isoform X2 [Mastacembelus armatus]|uniref:protein SON isoform X2 n=1 Tax=Mastacembelus armatus TaxID=205130 RepID=UPI000E454FD3|nr:protein SON-like isoform X2 [Mastacembelus armatus]